MGTYDGRGRLYASDLTANTRAPCGIEQSMDETHSCRSIARRTATLDASPPLRVVQHKALVCKSAREQHLPKDELAPGKFTRFIHSTPDVGSIRPIRNSVFFVHGILWHSTYTGRTTATGRVV